MSTRKAIFQMANLLTLSRVFLIPIIFWLFHIKSYSWMLGLLTYSLLSDFLDGWFARKLKQESDLGALLDPLCDKAVVISYMSYLAWEGLLPIWFAVLTLTRNISQFSAAPILGALKISFKVKPKSFPKWATAVSFLILGLQFLISALGEGRISSYIELVQGFALIPISAAMEAIILVTFVIRFTQILTGKHDTFE